MSEWRRAVATLGLAAVLAAGLGMRSAEAKGTTTSAVQR